MVRCVIEFVQKPITRVFLLSVLFVTITLAVIYPTYNSYLLITSPRDGQIFYRIPVDDQDSFTLTYRHSVSNSTVSGTFKLTAEQTILPLTTTFSSYGPGLPMHNEDEQISFADGLTTVYHDELPRSELRLWVSALTGETLIVGNQEIQLGNLAASPLLIEITYQQESHLFPFFAAQLN